MHNDPFTVWCDHLFKSIDRFPCKPADINKIFYYFNILCYGEMLVSLLPEVVRYGSDRITFIDRKSNNRCIGLIPAHKCYVGPMKSCNDRDVLSFLFQYLFCHIRCGSMRNSIMYMEQVQLIILNNIHHGAREGCFIGWVIKQRVSRDLHFVIKNIGSE